MISQETIKTLFRYDGQIGGLVYKKDFGKRLKAGTRVGHTHSRGYRHVIINNKLYKEHILVWILFNGPIPKGFQIDHKNNIRDWNEIGNLRLGTGNNNQHNRWKNKNNTSGYKGVSFDDGKWIAEITCKRIKYRLGRFETKEQAAIAYNNAAIKLHKEFAKLNIIK